MSNRKVKPISPDIIIKEVPDWVIEVFNSLIQENWEGKQAQFTVAKAIAALKEKSGLAEIRSEWLDIEDLYRNVGWKVTYDQPGYNESYPATYTFRRK